MNHHPPIRRRLRPGYTLIELLVTIVIIAILVAVIMGGVSKALNKARRVTCAAVMRTAATGLTSYMADNYGKTPAPPTKKDWDAIYGDPGGLYSTEWLLAVLLGSDGTFTEGDGSTASAKDANPSGTVYAEFERQSGPKGGLYVDEAGKAKLYDPWGREIIFAINSPVQGAYLANGYRDQVLYTWGLCEYKESKVDARPFAMLSAGEDGFKGLERGVLFDGNTTFAGSDDVISW
jgi:prepilin-type N-terminal cleavage/methylation domain-containing protein